MLTAKRIWALAAALLASMPGAALARDGDWQRIESGAISTTVRTLVDDVGVYGYAWGAMETLGRACPQYKVPLQSVEDTILSNHILYNRYYTLIDLDRFHAIGRAYDPGLYAENANAAMLLLADARQRRGDVGRADMAEATAHADCGADLLARFYDNARKLLILGRLPHIDDAQFETLIKEEYLPTGVLECTYNAEKLSDNVQTTQVQYYEELTDTSFATLARGDFSPYFAARDRFTYLRLECPSRPDPFIEASAGPTIVTTPDDLPDDPVERMAQYYLRVLIPKDRGEADDALRQTLVSEIGRFERLPVAPEAVTALARGRPGAHGRLNAVNCFIAEVTLRKEGYEKQYGTQTPLDHMQDKHLRLPGGPYISTPDIGRGEIMKALGTAWRVEGDACVQGNG